MEIRAVTKIDQTFKSARRFKEILTVLARHGFSEFFLETGISAWAKRDLGIELPGTSSPEMLKIPREERLRHVIEELGPTCIKVGQILSTRPDIIPLRFAEEFKKLQAEVAPVPFKEIRSLLEQEFPGQLDVIFKSIEEEPLATASLAQAHKAQLQSGQEVVLKVIKPGVRECIEADITVMTTLANFLEDRLTSRGFSPREVSKEFAQQLLREVDFLNEGRSANRLRALFADDETTKFPKAYMEYSTRNVLVMELIEGTLLSRLNKESLSLEQRRRIATHATSAVFKQCFEFGFFHADPHPGNIFVLPDEHLCFIDCGMTGRIDKKTTEELASLVSGVVHSDIERVLDAMVGLTEADRRLLDTRAFRVEMWDLIARFEDSTLASLDIGRLLSDFFDILRRNGIRCPGDLVFLIKAVTTIEGVVEELDPDFDAVSTMAPYLENFLYRRYGPQAIAQRVMRSLVSYAELLEMLPSSIRSTIERLQGSRFPLKVEHRGIDELTESINHTANSVSTALVVAALLVGSSILILADRVTGEAGLVTTLGSIGFIAAVLMIAWLFFVNHISKRR